MNIESRKDWLMWRRSGLGSSDAPILMNASRFKTRLQLYEDKISTDDIVEDGSYIMDKGNEAEIRVRSLFELMQGRNFSPGLCVLEDYPFIRASLDGWSEDKTEIAEIKLLTVYDSREPVNMESEGRIKFENVKLGILPDEYVDQVYHQLNASKANKCWFVGYAEDKAKRGTIGIEDIAIIEVLPNPVYQATLLSEEIKFWNEHVLKKLPPIPSDKDYKNLTGMAKSLNDWKKLKIKIDKLSEDLEIKRKEILAAAVAQGHPRYEMTGVRIRQESRIGTIQYKSIKELDGVDLEKYRGKGLTSWKMEIVE